MQNIEYLIHKVAYLFARNLSVEDIRFYLLKDNVSEGDIFLLITAGKILYEDWIDAEIDEEPTNPDGVAAKSQDKMKAVGSR